MSEARPKNDGYQRKPALWRLHSSGFPPSTSHATGHPSHYHRGYHPHKRGSARIRGQGDRHCCILLALGVFARQLRTTRPALTVQPGHEYFITALTAHSLQPWHHAYSLQTVDPVVKLPLHTMLVCHVQHTTMSTLLWPLVPCHGGRCGGACHCRCIIMASANYTGLAQATRN